jgi:hypothetical protein
MTDLQERITSWLFTGKGALLRVRPLLAFSVTFIVLYELVANQPVEPEILVAWVAIMGFYFGTRSKEG